MNSRQLSDLTERVGRGICDGCGNERDRHKGAVEALERLIDQAEPRSRGIGDAISATFALELAREALSHLRGQ